MRAARNKASGEDVPPGLGRPFNLIPFRRPPLFISSKALTQNERIRPHEKSLTKQPAMSKEGKTPKMGEMIAKEKQLHEVSPYYFMVR